MINKTMKISHIGLLIAVLLAVVVVVLGAYTRLTDAGLGCPDWPGCYNQLIAPHDQQEIQQATEEYPNVPVHVVKAWTEMVHRYAAGTLGIIILLLGIAAVRKRHVPNQPVLIPIILVSLVIVQALLGKWTVTMKLLPVVVMGHLLGGLIILALLWWLTLKIGNYFPNAIKENQSAFKHWAILGLIIVVVQIALGGWTSANYATLVCPNFPYCSEHLFFPQMDFRNAFNFFNISSGRLSHAALITIQMTHRIGAIVTGLYICVLVCLIFLKQRTVGPVLRRLGVFMLLVLIAQICLGVLNIEMRLPLTIAILHNAVAALLLLTLVTFVYVSSVRYEDRTL